VYGFRYGEGQGYGRQRRVVAPGLLRPIGYRAGGPTPQPGPGPNPAAGPGAQPAPGPQPTPNPTPESAPVAPNLPPLFGGVDLGGAFNAAITGFEAGGMILLGVLCVGVGLLLVLSTTSVGGTAAKKTAALAKHVAVAAITHKP